MLSGAEDYGEIKDTSSFDIATIKSGKIEKMRKDKNALPPKT